MIETDYRIGGLPMQYIVNPERALVNVPDEIRKCVAFLTYYPEPGKEIAAATAFFLYIRIGLTGGFTYLVTASHVIEKLRHEKKISEVFIRLNTKDGGAVERRTQIDQ